ncbi:hypothetical protein BDN71DRAFT_909070 [Pleurotus eryngii]|uniref:Uncharacterized protein n=1 Tax=Pleurotus eryngii TaxID=5323 RepID=A0A9P6A0A9_PLEER|nr:hypothetical protein BDN71DRAFT_909070 [Pleurotus eryngii]
MIHCSIRLGTGVPCHRNRSLVTMTPILFQATYCFLIMCSTDRGPSWEDDTMISMNGGSHVRQQSISSVIDGSPCVRMGRKKKDHSVYDSPGQVRIVEKPSIASTSSHQSRNVTPLNWTRLTSTQTSWMNYVSSLASPIWKIRWNSREAPSPLLLQASRVF